MIGQVQTRSRIFCDKHEIPGQTRYLKLLIKNSHNFPTHLIAINFNNILIELFTFSISIDKRIIIEIQNVMRLQYFPLSNIMFNLYFILFVI